jgi:polyhydroxybutyrate depolymerase
MRIALVFLGILLWFQGALPAIACDAQTRCTLPGGEYLVRPPARWDGKSALPVLLYVHGYGGSAEDTMRNTEFAAFTEEAGIMLVATNGDRNPWLYPSNPANLEADIAYINAVLDDVEKRFPVDRARMWASGFSIGGSRVWYYSCFMVPRRFVAFAPVAGAFGTPAPQECPAGPANIRHVHGTTDRTVPMAGRQLRSGMRQGDVRDAVALMRSTNGCTAEPVQELGGDETVCDVSAACSGARSLKLCMHPGEHFIEARFLKAAWEWIQTLPKTVALPK